MQSLRDKLMKAGLVSEEQAKRAEEEKKQQPPPPKGQPPANHLAPSPSQDRPERGLDRRPESPRAAAPESRIPRLPPLPGSRAHQRLESRKQLEQNKQVRELVKANEVEIDFGATVFYFMTRKKRLRRLTLTEKQAKQLENGELAVVERPEPAQIEHSLVPAATADEILKVSERSVRFFNRLQSPIGFMSDAAVVEQQELEARQGPEVASEPLAQPEEEPPAGSDT